MTPARRRDSSHSIRTSRSTTARQRASRRLRASGPENLRLPYGLGKGQSTQRPLVQHRLSQQQRGTAQDRSAFPEFRPWSGRRGNALAAQGSPAPGAAQCSAVGKCVTAAARLRQGGGFERRRAVLGPVTAAGAEAEGEGGERGWGARCPAALYGRSLRSTSLTYAWQLTPTCWWGGRPASQQPAEVPAVMWGIGGRIRPLRNGSPGGRRVGPGSVVLLAASVPRWSPVGRAVPKRSDLIPGVAWAGGGRALEWWELLRIMGWRVVISSVDAVSYKQRGGWEDGKLSSSIIALIRSIAAFCSSAL